MSTRSAVIVKQEGQQDVYLYHHFDGYPDGVGYSLLCESKTWNEWNKWYNNSIVNELIKDKEDDGYEFTQYIHSDIEYLYIIDCDKKKISCFQVLWGLSEPEEKQLMVSEQNHWKKYEDIYNGKWGKEIDLYQKFPQVFNAEEKGE